MRVFFNIILRRSQPGALFQLDDTIILKKEQRSCFIRGVVGHRDLITVCDLVKAFLCAGINTKGLIMDAAGIYQMGTLLIVEAV